MKSGSAGEFKKKKTHPKHFQLTASPYGCVSLIERVYWCWGGRGTRCFKSGLFICIQLLDQSHIFLQTKLTVFFFSFLGAIVARRIQRDQFYSHFYICLIIFFFFYNRKTFTGFIGLFFFTLFDMLLHQCNSNEKRKTNRNIHFLVLT